MHLWAIRTIAFQAPSVENSRDHTIIFRWIRDFVLRAPEVNRLNRSHLIVWFKFIHLILWVHGAVHCTVSFFWLFCNHKLLYCYFIRVFVYRIIMFLLLSFMRNNKLNAFAVHSCMFGFVSMSIFSFSIIMSY